MLLGLVLVGYGLVEVSLSNLADDNPTKQSLCAAWFCPGEFTDSKAFTLQQRSEGGAALSFLPYWQRALVDDSASAYHWANLAELKRDAGDDKLAEYCFKRAVAAGPSNPAILFRAANYEFEQGRADDVMKILQRILRDPELASYYQPVFLTYSRLGVPVEEIIPKGLPMIEGAAKPFLQFWMEQNKVQEASAVWQWMAAKSLITDQASGEYVAFLMRNGQLEMGLQEWMRVHHAANTTYRDLNWIYNPGFETDPAPGPLDWHIGSTKDVEASRVEDVSREGQWAGSLFFNGKSDAEYHDFYQYALVTPGRWRLRAFLKLQDITSDGVALRIFDAEMPTRLDVKTSRAGTSGWDEVEETFDVGPETKLLRIELMHAGGPITGRVWIDSVELAPVRVLTN